MLKFPAVLNHGVASAFFRSVTQNLAALPDGVAVDASALGQFDSSALAILLECRRQALASGKTFSVRGAPERLTQLAEVYGVASLLGTVPEARERLATG